MKQLHEDKDAAHASHVWEIETANETYLNAKIGEIFRLIEDAAFGTSNGGTRRPAQGGSLGDEAEEVGSLGSDEAEEIQSNTSSDNPDSLHDAHPVSLWGHLKTSPACSNLTARLTHTPPPPPPSPNRTLTPRTTSPTPPMLPTPAETGGPKPQTRCRARAQTLTYQTTAAWRWPRLRSPSRRPSRRRPQLLESPLPGPRREPRPSR